MFMCVKSNQYSLSQSFSDLKVIAYLTTEPKPYFQSHSFSDLTAVIAKLTTELKAKKLKEGKVEKPPMPVSRNDIKQAMRI